MKITKHLVLAPLRAAVAHADGGAPAKTTSDIDSSNTDVHINIHSDYGDLETANHEAELKLGYSKVDGKSAETAGAKLTMPVYINGSKDNTGTKYGFQVDPNLSVQATYDPETKSILMIDVTAGKLTAFHVEDKATKGSPSASALHCARVGGKWVASPGAEDPIRQGECVGVKTNATLDFSWLPVEGGIHINNVQGTKTMGAEIGVPVLLVGPSRYTGHVAFKIEGTNIDLCYDVEPVKLLLGTNQIKDVSKTTAWKFVNARICAGVSLGEKVGHLYDRASFNILYIDEANGPWAMKVSNEAGIEKIGGTPLGVGYTYTKSYVTGGDGNTSAYGEHNFALKGAF